jgi:hypothetical protein
VLSTPASTQGYPRPTASSRKKGKKKADEDNGDFQEPDKMVNVLFGGLPTKRSQKATRREVLNIEPVVPTPLRWSEVPINRFFKTEDSNSRLTLSLILPLNLRLEGYSIWSAILQSHIHII